MLDDRIRRLRRRAKRFDGTVYRSASPEYANTNDLVTGEGSRLYGGRWNPTGVAAVYGSLTAETAMAETLAHANHYNLPAHSAMPRTFVAIAISVSKVLDLTDGSIRQALRVSEKRMLQCDWRAEVRRGQTPVSQVIGAAIYEAGLEGLLAPSAAHPGGKNLVVFPKNLLKTSHLSVLSEDEL